MPIEHPGAGAMADIGVEQRGGDAPAVDRFDRRRQEQGQGFELGDIGIVVAAWAIGREAGDAAGPLFAGQEQRVIVGGPVGFQFVEKLVIVGGELEFEALAIGFSAVAHDLDRAADIARTDLRGGEKVLLTGAGALMPVARPGRHQRVECDRRHAQPHEGRIAFAHRLAQAADQFAEIARRAPVRDQPRNSRFEGPTIIMIQHVPPQLRQHRRIDWRSGDGVAHSVS